MSKKKKGNSSLAYEGKVTLKILHGNKIVKTIKQKNAGTLQLMTFLAKCLGGYYKEELTPRHIRLFNVSDGESIREEYEVTLNSIVTNFQPSYNEDADHGISSVTISFLVPSTQINNSDSGFNTIAIYSSESRNNILNYMASIVLDDNTTIKPGESLLILWEMSLQNITQGE